jgi:hypothetical protein
MLIAEQIKTATTLGDYRKEHIGAVLAATGQ